MQDEEQEGIDVRDEVLSTLVFTVRLAGSMARSGNADQKACATDIMRRLIEKMEEIRGQNDDHPDQASESTD
jgi:hypothetical protein